MYSARRRKLHLSLFSLSILSLAFFVAMLGPDQNKQASAEEVTSVNPIADTYVNSRKPGKNFGTVQSMFVDNNPKKISYIKFDLTSLAGKTVLDAKLQLKVATDGSSANQNIKQVTDSGWNETAMTYSNRPTLSSSILATLRGGAVDAGVEADLTSFVSANTGRVVSIGIETTNANSVNYYTREASSYKPLLTLTLQSPPTGQPSGSLSITDYGATPNDTTDDTTAIKNAIAAAKAQGKSVFIPAGTFQHTEFNLDSVSMNGIGDSSVLYAPNPTLETIHVLGNGTKLTKLKVQTPATSRIGGQDHIEASTATNFLIQDVTIDGSNAAGFIMFGGGIGRVINNRVLNTKADSIHMSDSSHDMIVANNYVRNSGDDMIAVVSYNPSQTPVSEILIQNNDVADGSARGISVVGGKDITIEGNKVGRTPCCAGILIAAESSYNTAGVANVLVKNNQLSDNSGRTGHGAIHLSGFNPGTTIDRVRLEANTISNPAWDSIKLEGTNSNTAIISNTMIDPENRGINVVSGINVYCSASTLNGAPASSAKCTGAPNFTVTGSNLTYP